MTPVRGAGFIKQDTGVARDLEGRNEKASNRKFRRKLRKLAQS